MAIAPSLWARDRWRQAGRDLRKLFPLFLFVFAVRLTLPYWVWFMVDLFLRSFLIAPSGLWAWLAVVLLVGAFFAAFASVIFRVARHAPAVRAARKSVTLGDTESLARYEAARTEYRAKIKLHGILLGWLAAIVAIPPSVALTLWADMQHPSSIVVNGRERMPTPQQRLRASLRVLEKHGLFTPWSSDDADKRQ